MVGYELRSQDVSACLEFTRCSLQGATVLTFARASGAAGEASSASRSGGRFVLPLTVPVVAQAQYKRVCANGADAAFHLAKVLDSGVDAGVVNDSCPNVDLVTLEGIHVAAQEMQEALLYVELPELPAELVVEVQFEYLQLDRLSDDIYFERHWLLPRCSTSYREYAVFVSGAGSTQWFPTVMLTRGLTVAEDCAYRVDVTVPIGHSVISGMPLDDSSGENGGVEHSEDSVMYRFRLSSRHGQGVLPCHSFGLFAGEFDLWDGAPLQNRKATAKEEAHQVVEDEDALEEFSRRTPCRLGNNVPVTYVTLKGFGFLLEPTNIATPQCLETYKRVLDLEAPASVFLLFLPGPSFPPPVNLSTHLRAQTYMDIKRCTAYTGSENCLHSAFLHAITTPVQGMYYQSGNNIVVYSMDVLHSYSDLDHDPRTLECRLVVAHGLALLYTLKGWVNPSRDIHLDLMLQSYLVDQFVKRNMGVNEYRVRLWARREVFASLTETVGDSFPLCQSKGTSTSTHLLMDNQPFQLKCHLLPTIMDALFTASNFLPDNFLIQSMRRRIVALSKAGYARRRGEPNCAKKASHDDIFGLWSDGDTFWKMVGDDMIKRYISAWNAKPPNRLVLENQLDGNSKLEEILRRGVEHDHLSTIVKQYNSLVRSFVYGTGCPQINMSFALQLQRKGTSMDHLNFRVDIKSLQPPLDITKEGETAYSVCQTAGISARNLLETYLRLARVLQLEEQPEDNPAGSPRRVFERVLKLYGVENDEHCASVPHVLDFADIATPLTISASSEAGILRRNMGLLQMWHDPVDLVGRDGNFMMGFGYVGMFPYTFCLGNGPICDCLEILKQCCDVNSIIDSFVDNGSSYCGSYTFNNGYERIFGKGSLPVATNGGIPFWQLVYQQALMLESPDTSVPLSGGFSKQWISPFKADIVEDDGVRENVKMIGDLVPASYKVNPRAERGRKKVAVKGVPEKDLEDAVDDTNRKNTYVGHRSESDRMVIEWMKMLFIGIHPELAQLDNRSVVAKICSKTRLPILWMRIDSGFRLIARIRRCQSSSMWEQQLLSDNNVQSQIEAAAALGSFGRSPHFTTCENPILRVAATKLEQMIRRHRVHPAVRSRCIYSLVCIHNRDFREHENIQRIFSNYLSSFSLNNTGANYWHPSEARFMLDFFKATALLRNRNGFSPQMSVDILAKVLEGMNGINYLVHATNIVECCSYLSIPGCAIRHQEAGGQTCVDVKRLWQLLWHLFRLDGIPGSGSCNRVLTAAFLRCLSRQPLLLDLCFAKTASEKDLGFEFDFHLFMPLQQNVVRAGQAAFELGQTYHSLHVHFAAIYALLRVLMTGAFVVDDDADMDCDGRTPWMRMVKVQFEEQAERIQSFAGVHEAVRCCIKLCARLLERSLKLHVWEALSGLVEELAQSLPVLFLDLRCPLARKTRDLLYGELRQHAISAHAFNAQMFIKMRNAICLLFGPGYCWPDDLAPDANLVAQRLDRLTSGLSMPRIAAFRRVHGDGGRSGSKDWVEVAVEAVGALKELPQARWFIHDPEKSIIGYRSMVRHPMWLVKIEQKALGGEYAIPMQFKADMALVFKNAKTVNKADTMPFADARVLEEQFETLWPAIVRTFQRNALSSSAQ